MKTTAQTVIIYAILLGLLYPYAAPEQFYGGSMSYKMEKQPDGNQLIIIELITGWVLREGPCGKSCNKSDIGRSTRSTRPTMLSPNPNYLGTFTKEYKASDGLTKTVEIKERVNSTFNETVIAISEHAKWEQEIMHFSVIMEKEKKEIDISFEGYSWRDLSYQSTGSDIKWHFQTKIVSSIRSDTNTTNRSPKSLAKPFYRIKLGKVSEIRIPAVDADEDFIKCEISKLVEGGYISLNPPPNVTVVRNCTVYINASQDNGYEDDSWIAVPVSVRDYNKKDIRYGTGNYPAGKYSLSTTTVQFVVQILANLTTPEFVEPTYLGNHVFILYSDTEWRTQIYAEATENTTIEEFITFGIQREKFIISEAQQDPKRSRVKFAIMSWKPSISDVGSHIACVSVTDNTGVDSDEERCFVLDVYLDVFNHSSTYDANKPYFIDIPSPNQLVDCKIHATCVVPIYVQSKENVSEIHVTDSYIDKYEVGPIQYIKHKDEMVYKADLSFEHSMHGKENICFKAKDENGIESETVCITSHIEPPDPCISAPCRNSATCVRDKDTGGFKCLCMLGTSGKTCEIRKDPCIPNPCFNNRQCYGLGVCWCEPSSGFTGSRCEKNINDCNADSCNRRGTCIDGIKSYKCECFDHYSGENCTKDECPSQRSAVNTCPADNCTTNSCNRRGVCSAGGVCSCPYGYTGRNCETPKCDISGTVSGVISPSPRDGSTVICYDSNKELSCNIRVYVTTQSSSTPKISSETTNELRSIMSVGSAKTSSDLPGISPVYSVDITIDGPMNSSKSQYFCIKAEYTTSSSKACYKIRTVLNPEEDIDSQAYAQKNATVKFVQPTLKDHSRIICTVGTRCQLLLYTTIVSNRTSCKMTNSLAAGTAGSSPSDRCDTDDKDNDADDADQTSKDMSPCCQDVISSTKGVTVYRAHPREQSCVTEASIFYNRTGEREICFQSGYSEYQQLCYKVGVYADKKDPCSNSPCQNNGQCFHAGHDKFSCICPDNYIGHKCEQGPCQSGNNNCQNDAYCQTDNGVDKCICKAGFSGRSCSKASSGLSSTSNEERSFDKTFTDTAKPKVFSCVLNQKCSFALIVSVQSGQTPTVSPGYVEPSLLMEEIETNVRAPLKDSYQANIQLKATQLGLKIVCIQTKDMNGVNKDELCAEVNVVSDVISLYTFKDRPHFVEPSLPTDAEVECVADGPCHVLYHVTPGTGNENECVTFKAHPPSGFVNYFLYSSCDTCKPGEAFNGNCTVDVSVVNTIADKNTTRRICVSVGLKGSSVEGEQRCFNITIQDKSTVVKKGCQTLECKNGGFCDGHDTENPVCFCPKGFSGTDCDKVIVDSPMTGTQTQSFLGDFTVPSEVKCVINEECNIPFQVISKPGHAPNVSLGYNDPRLSVMQPSFQPLVSSPTTFQGKVVASPNTVGDFKVCLQATGNSKTEDELCVMVKVISTAIVKTDKTKPYFLAPTLSAESTVICETKKACHFDMHFTSGDMFTGLSGVCPTLIEKSSSPVTGLHIFDVHKENSTMCTGDVSFVPPQADDQHQLCFQVSLPGKKGEIRCYAIKVVADINKEVLSPCRGVKCEHNGKCLADFKETLAKYSCICKSASFDGKNCEQSINKMKDLPGVSNLNGTVSGEQHFEGDSGIPTEIKCEPSSECCINTPYIGRKNNPPLIGYIDSKLMISAQNVLETGSTDLTRHIAQTCVQIPPTGGPFRMCQQTTSDGTTKGVNIDEICTKINVQPKAPKNNTVSPHFTTNIPDGSRVLCKPNKICHNQILTANMSNGECSQVKECGPGVAGVHFFETSLVGNLCITDLAIKTTNPEMLDLCISAGSGGEQNNLKIEVKDSSGFGPCQGLHCLNGGSCVAITESNAVCKCLAGYTGKVCETDIDECKSKPCKHGATCLDKVNAYQCICSPGYNGTNCNDMNGCDAKPCKHGSTCVDNVNNYTCTCVYGYTGRNCDEVLSTTAVSIKRTTTTELTMTSTLTSKPTTTQATTLTTAKHSTLTTSTTTTTTTQPTTLTTTTKQTTLIITTEPTTITKPTTLTKTTEPKTTKPTTLTTTTEPTTTTKQMTLTTTTEPSSTKPMRMTTKTKPTTTTKPTTLTTTTKPTITRKPTTLTITTELKSTNTEPTTTTRKPTTLTTKTKPTTTRKPTTLTTTTKPTTTRKPTTLTITTELKSTNTEPTTTTKPTSSKKNCMCNHGQFASSTSSGCICYEGWSGRVCDKVGGSRTHTGIKTDLDNSPPAFTEYVIPEIIPCKINKPCNIMFPVDGLPSLNPIVEHGDSDPGLMLTSPIEVNGKSGVPCDNKAPKCAYEATITVSPTELKLYKYCVRTEDYNSIPADELCYKIQGVKDDTNPPGIFSYPPTLPENSTMSCSYNQTCHYQLAIDKNAVNSCNESNIHSTSSDVHVLPSNSSNNTTCKYDVVYIPSKEATGKQSFCISPTNSPTKKHCMVVDVTEKCDTKKASQEAREMVTKGYASCFCVVNKKKVQIIKKRPVAQKNKIFKAAGFGAGAVSGTMVLGVVVYMIVNKVRQPSVKRKPPTTRPASASSPSSRQKSRVHPQGRTRAY